MKFIVSIKPVEPTNRLTVDFKNPDIAFSEGGIGEFIQDYLGYTTLYKEIVVTNIRSSIPKELLQALTNQFLHGTVITFESVNHFKQTYRCPQPRAFYQYAWTPLDLSAPIPRSLAEFRFIYNGKLTSYREAISSLKSTRFLPNEIWNALDVYSKRRIDLCREWNKGVYEYAEQWYKDLTKDAMPHGIKVWSPNLKTYLEAIAELDFERLSKSFTLKEGLRPLSDDELAFLQEYGPAYGVEVPTLVTRINTHKTKHGYTQEPEYMFGGVPESEIVKAQYDSRAKEKGTLLPAFVRRTLRPTVHDNAKLARDAYFNLIWIMRHAKELPNEGLMPGWARCPECHEIYRVSEGCDCGAQEPIIHVTADNKFYSDTESFEDITLRDLLY